MQLFWIALGGALGTVARYLTAVWAARVLGPSFPFGTLLVNFTGSLALSLVMQIALMTNLLSPTLRLALTTGFMGGFTTYSTFNFELLSQIAGGAYAIAAGYLLVTVLGCLAGGWLGVAVGRGLAGFWSVG